MSKRVLIVDDEEDLVDIMKTLLADAGYEVLTACDGEECLRVLRTVNPHLIIMDILMPKMTGYEVINKIRGMKGTNEIPIIVATARKDMKNFLDSWDVADFIFKPLNPDDLIAKVKKAIFSSSQPETIVDSKSGDEEHHPTQKKAVIASSSDFVTLKMKSILEGQGYWVVIVSKNEDVIREIEKTHPPDLIVCEMSNSSTISTEMIYKWVEGKPSRISFLVFCPEESSGKALETFQESQVIVYDNLEELLIKLEKHVKTKPRKAA